MLERSLRTILWSLLVLWLALAVGCLFLITIWTDEAWTLGSVRSLGEPVVENLSVDVILTSGGPYALGNLLLEKVYGSDIWIHRAFSFVCLLGIFAIVYRTATRRGRPAFDGLLALVPLLSITGTAEIGTLALGQSAACLLMVWGAAVWSRDESPGLVRWLFAGTLFGLSAACRTEMALLVAPLVAIGAVRWLPSGRVAARLPWREAIAAAVLLAVFAACLYALRVASPLGSQGDELEKAAASSGVSGGLLGRLLDYPRILNKLLIGQAFGPMLLLMLASTLPFSVPSEDPAERRFSVFLIASAWVLALGWVTRAPIPHLRYLWPALMSFAIPAGLAMARLYDTARREGRTSTLLVILLVSLGGVAGGVLGTARSLVMGEGNLISFEWSREMGVDYFRRFQAIRDEAHAVRFLKTQIPPEADIYSTVPFKYKYLTHRPIIDMTLIYTPKERAKSAAATGKPRRKYLALSPDVGTYFYLSPEGDAWIRANARLAAQFGRHSIYEIDADWPEDPDLLWFHRTNYLRHPLSAPWFGRVARPASFGPQATK